MVYYEKPKAEQHEEPLSLDEAKLLLGIDFDWKDAEIEALVIAARQQAERYTGLSLVKKRIVIAFDIPPKEFFAPCPPLINISVVTAYTADGGTEDITAKFEAYPAGIQNEGIIEAKNAFVYPPKLRLRQAVIFEIEAGLDKQECPQAIRDALGFYVLRAYDGNTRTEWLPSFHTLLTPYRLVTL